MYLRLTVWPVVSLSLLQAFAIKIICIIMSGKSNSDLDNVLGGLWIVEVCGEFYLVLMVVEGGVSVGDGWGSGVARSEALAMPSGVKGGA